MAILDFTHSAYRWDYPNSLLKNQDNYYSYTLKYMIQYNLMKFV
jgi:hypothetical protein